MHLGIDFGTTRTVVAACDRGNYPVVSFCSDAGDSVDWYPSVVAHCNGTWRFGWDAVAVSTDPKWHCLRSFKRLLTDPQVRPDQVVRVGSAEVALVDLLTMFLCALRRDLSNNSNLPTHLCDIDTWSVYVSVPANSHGTQRFVTLDAFRKAGFHVMGVLNEPSAAGFEYAHRHASTLTSRREHVVVYDLGGGTFDASLVRISGQFHDVVYTEGVARLGGDDFDAVLMELVLQHPGMAGIELDVQQTEQLMDVCRQAKEALCSTSRKVLVDVHMALGDGAPCAEVALAVSTYYEACAPLISRTVGVMEALFERDELAQGGIGSMPGVAGVYVVGGASALPAVARTLRVRWGRRVHRSPYPSAATAIGLAIAGDGQAGYRLGDRFSRAFGVFRELREGASVSFDAIFTKDTRVPSVGEEPVSATRTYRAAHNVGHFRYIECESTDARGCPSGEITPFVDVRFPFDPSLFRDDVELGKVPVQRLESTGPIVQEHYTVDEHGMVRVCIRNCDAGYERTYLLWGE